VFEGKQKQCSQFWFLIQFSCIIQSGRVLPLSTSIASSKQASTRLELSFLRRKGLN